VDSQERKAGVGDGVDEAPDEMLSLGAQLVVFSTKRDNPTGDGRFGKQRHVVRIEACAVDQTTRLEGFLTGYHLQTMGAALDGPYRMIEENPSSVQSEAPGIGLGHLLKVDNAGCWNMQRLPAAGVRFQLPRLGIAQQPQSRHSIGDSPPQ